MPWLLNFRARIRATDLNRLVWTCERGFGFSTMLLALVLVFVAACVAEQRFAETPPSYLEVAAGDEVQLRCKVHDKKGECIWQKNRRPVGMFTNKYEWVSRRDGDCTLLIRNAQLDLDDADWECQVTPGDLNQQDSLTSPPARLLVRGGFGHFRVDPYRTPRDSVTRLWKVYRSMIFFSLSLFLSRPLYLCRYFLFLCLVLRFLISLQRNFSRPSTRT